MAQYGLSFVQTSVLSLWWYFRFVQKYEWDNDLPLGLSAEYAATYLHVIE